MSPVKRFDWRMEEYRQAFETLLRCSTERAALIPFLRGALKNNRSTEVGMDWGAGDGDLLPLLLENCSEVLACEPSPAMREVLVSRYPTVELLEGDVRTACPTSRIDCAWLSHVLYHLPDEEWKSIVMRLAEFLGPEGRLYVVMKGADSGCNKMLAHFGAARFDLQAQLRSEATDPFEIRFTELPAGVVTQAYEETEAIARFMLCDRREDEFSDSVSESEFQAYVREHFWNEQQSRGGWDYGLVVAEISHRPE